MPRGYFGIGIYNARDVNNVGTLWRSAHCFGADFIFTVGSRYGRREASDTTDARRHVPFYEYKSIEDLQPKDAYIVCIELTDKAETLKNFVHPERAIYLLGAEDTGLPEEITNKYPCVKVQGGKYCLNVSVAGSIVLYDRITKMG